MRSRNRDILVRLEGLTGKPALSPAFFDGCHAFRNHAKEWERMWKLVMDSEPEQGSSELIRKQQMTRRRFPSNFESSLDAEIARLKHS
jgi:hypothetical protein